MRHDLGGQHLDLLEVEYEILPAVFDENEAIVDGAPVIHDEPDIDGAHDPSRNIVHHLEAAAGLRGGGGRP